jgi:hypothetical protein
MLKIAIEIKIPQFEQVEMRLLVGFLWVSEDLS